MRRIFLLVEAPDDVVVVVDVGVALPLMEEKSTPAFLFMPRFFFSSLTVMLFPGCNKPIFVSSAT